MYEAGGVEVMVTGYVSDAESKIIALLVDEGYTCSVDEVGVITAKCDGVICYQETAEELARNVVEIDGDYRDYEDDVSECRVDVEVERLVGETFSFDGGDFEPGGDCYKGGATHEYESVEDLLDELDS